MPDSTSKEVTYNASSQKFTDTIIAGNKHYTHTFSCAVGVDYYIENNTIYFRGKMTYDDGVQYSSYVSRPLIVRPGGGDISPQ